MTLFIGFQSHHYRIGKKIYKADYLIPLFNVHGTGTRLDGSTISLKSLIDLGFFKTIIQREK